MYDEPNNLSFIHRINEKLKSHLIDENGFIYDYSYW